MADGRHGMAGHLSRLQTNRVYLSECLRRAMRCVATKVQVEMLGLSDAQCDKAVPSVSIGLTMQWALDGPIRLKVSLIGPRRSVRIERERTST